MCVCVCVCVCVDTLIIKTKGSITGKKENNRCLGLKVVDFDADEEGQTAGLGNELRTVEKGRSFV